MIRYGYDFDILPYYGTFFVNLIKARKQGQENDPETQEAQDKN